MTLNTPEEIEAWKAERKKRFPTASRVADKKAKLEEAIARGQLPFDETHGSRNDRGSRNLVLVQTEALGVAVAEGGRMVPQVVMEL
jgi:hypothetical protein